VQSFEVGQTWIWQDRRDPETWVLWFVLEVRRNCLFILTLASGAFEEMEKSSADEPGAAYLILAECIMAVTSTRVL